jgi:hypothetical protein
LSGQEYPVGGLHYVVLGLGDLKTHTHTHTTHTRTRACEASRSRRQQEVRAAATYHDSEEGDGRARAVPHVEPRVDRLGGRRGEVEAVRRCGIEVEARVSPEGPPEEPLPALRRVLLALECGLLRLLDRRQGVTLVSCASCVSCCALQVPLLVVRPGRR